MQMMGVILVQAVGKVHAVKQQLVQLWVLSTISPLEVLTISGLLTELIMAMLPKPLH